MSIFHEYEKAISIGPLRGRAGSWGGLLAGLLVLASCGRDSGGQDVPEIPEGWVELGRPPPGTPWTRGLLVPGPAALELRPEETVQLWWRLLDFAAAGSSEATCSWRSGDERVASVTGAGVVRAVGVGATDVVATCEGGHRASVPVTVRDEGSSNGVYSLAADPPVTVIGIGEATSVSVVALDRLGRVAPGPVALNLVSSRPDVVRVEPDGRLIGLAGGIALLSAIHPENGEGMPTTATVIVRGPMHDSPRCGPDADIQIESCSFSSLGLPVTFTEPGLEGELWVLVCKSKSPVCGELPTFWCEVETPSRVAVRYEGVLELAGSGLRSVAPGATAVQVSVEDVPCAEYVVQVGPRVSGTWNVECDDGETGAITLLTSPPGVSYRTFYTPAQDPPFFRGATGGACFVGGPGACSGHASASLVGSMVTPGGGLARGPCTEAVPCEGPDLDACAAALRMNPDGGDTAWIESETRWRTDHCRLMYAGSSCDPQYLIEECVGDLGPIPPECAPFIGCDCEHRAEVEACEELWWACEDGCYERWSWCEEACEDDWQCVERCAENIEDTCFCPCERDVLAPCMEAFCPGISAECLRCQF